jgi:hypothetical protein
MLSNVRMVDEWKNEKNLKGTGCVDWELSIFSGRIV